MVPARHGGSPSWGCRPRLRLLATLSGLTCCLSAQPEDAARGGARDETCLLQHVIGVADVAARLHQGRQLPPLDEIARALGLSHNDEGSQVEMPVAQYAAVRAEEVLRESAALSGSWQAASEGLDHDEFVQGIADAHAAVVSYNESAIIENRTAEHTLQNQELLASVLNETQSLLVRLENESALINKEASVLEVTANEEASCDINGYRVAPECVMNFTYQHDSFSGCIMNGTFRYWCSWNETYNGSYSICEPCGSGANGNSATTAAPTSPTAPPAASALTTARPAARTHRRTTARPAARSAALLGRQSPRARRSTTRRPTQAPEDDEEAAAEASTTSIAPGNATNNSSANASTEASNTSGALDNLTNASNMSANVSAVEDFTFDPFAIAAAIAPVAVEAATEVVSGILSPESTRATQIGATANTLKHHAESIREMTQQAKVVEEHLLRAVEAERDEELRAEAATRNLRSALVGLVAAEGAARTRLVYSNAGTIAAVADAANASSRGMASAESALQHIAAGLVTESSTTESSTTEVPDETTVAETAAAAVVEETTTWPPAPLADAATTTLRPNVSRPPAELVQYVLLILLVMVIILMGLGYLRQRQDA